MRTISILFLVLAVMACKRKPSLKTGLEGKTMPAFNLLMMDSSTKFSTVDIPAGKPVIIFYFSPRCPYCKAELNMMLDDIESLKNMQVCMVTNNFPFKEVKEFYSSHHIRDYPNIVFGYDSVNSVARYFKVQGVPYTSVYGGDGKLKGEYVGLITVRDIVATANE